MRREDGRLRMEEGGRRRRKKDRGRRMEEPHQDLRTEYRAAMESSGSAGFGLASVGMLGVPGPESSQRGSDGKWGLAQGWIPLREQERRLLRVRERGPERTPFRGLEQMLFRTQAREPLRQQGR